jgi:hypothetical protein
MDNEDKCKDCRTSPICLTKRYSHLCPCPTCLIKIMCSKTCVPYSKFFNSAIAEKFQITEEKKYVHKR